MKKVFRFHFHSLKQFPRQLSRSTTFSISHSSLSVVDLMMLCFAFLRLLICALIALQAIYFVMFASHVMMKATIFQTTNFFPFTFRRSRTISLAITGVIFTATDTTRYEWKSPLARLFVGHEKSLLIVCGDEWHGKKRRHDISLSPKAEAEKSFDFMKICSTFSRPFSRSTLIKNNHHIQALTSRSPQ